MNKLCIVNVVGLTPKLAAATKHIRSVGAIQPWISPIPAVTCTSQATMLTGLSPSQHGIVGNGWYARDTAEIRFWQQSNHLIQGKKFYEGIETAKLFWWFNQHAPVRWSVTPKPHYGSDGSKVFDVLDRTDCDLTKKLGPFPFSAFWGPMAGLPSSQWIAEASTIVMRKNRPDLTLIYLPHLDYDLQRFPEAPRNCVEAVDECVAPILVAADEIGAKVIIVSEYGLVPVTKSISLNRHLRDASLLSIRRGPFGEMLIPGDSDAFAVVDHQVAHIYVKDPARKTEVQSLLQSVDGVDRVVDPEELDLHHPRSGDLIALAKPDSWFNYYYWKHDGDAPDFARTVDIHRKPGYDPVELFMTSKLVAMKRLIQKNLGFRYRFDVIPLDASLVKGSHGLRPDSPDGPVIIGPQAPSDMKDFKAYVESLLGM